MVFEIYHHKTGHRQRLSASESIQIKEPEQKRKNSAFCVFVLDVHQSDLSRKPLAQQYPPIKRLLLCSVYHFLSLTKAAWGAILFFLASHQGRAGVDAILAIRWFPLTASLPYTHTRVRITTTLHKYSFCTVAGKRRDVKWNKKKRKKGKKYTELIVKIWTVKYI